MSYYARRNVGAGAVLAVPVAMVVEMIIDGFLIKTLWNWFVPEVFDNAPRLGIAQAIGLSLVASSLVSVRSSDRDYEGLSLWGVILTALIGAMIKLVVVLIAGAIVHSVIV